MGLAAPAMVVPALVAAVEAEARAGHAATLHVAAKGLHVTPPAIPARAHAPRFTLTKAMVCLRAGWEIFTSHYEFCILTTDHLVLLVYTVFLCCHFLVAVFILVFIFTEEMSLVWPCHSSAFSFS